MQPVMRVHPAYSGFGALSSLAVEKGLRWLTVGERAIYQAGHLLRKHHSNVQLQTAAARRPSVSAGVAPAYNLAYYWTTNSPVIVVGCTSHRKK